jgi:hypothetical protein
MATFKDPIKIGPVGAEIQLAAGGDDAPDDQMTIQIGDESQGTNNLLGEAASIMLRRFQANVSLSISGLGRETTDALMSLNGQKTREVSFIFADAWKINSEHYVMSAARTFTMESSPWLLLDRAYNNASLGRIVTLTSVYATNDLRGAQGGTNLILSGGAAALDRATWDVTIDSDLAENDNVYVNYTWQGILAMLRQPISRVLGGWHPSTGERLWNVQLQLRGI